MSGVANTILAQLGGNRFVAMTGAKQFLSTKDGLRFSLPSRFAKDGINKIEISLTPWDTYNIKFYKVGPGPEYKVTKISEVDNTYADNLRNIISERTGLVLSIGEPEGKTVSADKFPKAAGRALARRCGRSHKQPRITRSK
jgi:hypothetical protein